ncbi:MAG: ABC transporter [Nitrospiraceae bacterium]|nr:MAG: ABC transporter [Nitrospiraceae bacterium]
MPESLVRFESVKKAFGAVQALDGVTFTVEPEEVFAFIGPNGSGKTTTIRILLGIYQADDGTVEVLGLDPNKDFSRIGPQLGVMLEHPATLDLLTGEEYLDLYAGLFCLTARESAERRAEALKRVGLANRAKERLGTYSKGMRQRMSLARCLLNRPRLLVLDEPFDGIDAESRRDLIKVLPDLTRGTGASVFITSHNLSEVERIATRVAIIDRGRVARLDSVHSLCAPVEGQEVLVVTLSKAGAMREMELQALFPAARWDGERRQLLVSLREVGRTREAILNELLGRGIDVEAFEMKRVTLEEVYFSVTDRGRRL